MRIYRRHAHAGHSYIQNLSADGSELRDVINVQHSSFFALPFTLIRELGWATIPVVTVVAFTFMGIEGIAEEIENPFGHDEGDLPLDRYCADLREEVEFMIAKMPEGGIGAFGWDDGEGDD